jgi:hypothetical protein
MLEIHRHMEQVQEQHKLSEVAFLCDEWWEVTHENSLNQLDTIFTLDTLLRRSVRKVGIVILMVVTITYSYSLEISTQQNF